jgi:hypothetical protein
MINRRASAILAFFMLVLTVGCEQVHYRTHGFEWVSANAASSVAVDVAATGTSQIQDSAGVLIERRASPYRLGIYFRRTSAVPVEVIEVILTGQASGVVITPQVGQPAGLQDGSLTVVAVAPAVQLPFEDYRVQIRVRIGSGPGAIHEQLTGVLRTRFEQSKALRFWEELMSV